MSKTQATSQLREHLSRLFDARHRGAEANSFNRAQGYADGYVQALTDADLLTFQEALDIIHQERRASAHRADSPLRRIPISQPAPDFA